MGLKLTPNPTFKANVEIRIPGQQSPAKVPFTFKFKDGDEMKAFLEGLKDSTSDKDLVMEICEGWGVDAKFDEDNVETFLKNYLRSAHAILTTYLTEMTGAAMGN